MNLLAIDLVACNLSEIDEMMAALWADRPVPADYGDEVTYNRDVEVWYDRMQEMSEALTEASEFEQEINSIGSI